MHRPSSWFRRLLAKEAQISKMLNKIKKTKGFTLVEAIVAVAVLLVGVTAASSAAQSGLFSTSTVRERITSTFLAQEAIEGVRNIKDSNILRIYEVALDSDPDNDDSVYWLDGITNTGGSAGPCGPVGSLPCGYDVIGGPDSVGEMVACSEDGSCPVDAYDDDGFMIYRQAGGSIGEETGYTRHIYVEEIVSDSEALVTVIISKPGGGNDFRMSSVINRAWF